MPKNPSKGIPPGPSGPPDRKEPVPKSRSRKEVESGESLDMGTELLWTFGQPVANLNGWSLCLRPRFWMFRRSGRPVTARRYVPASSAGLALCTDGNSVWW